MRRASSAKPAPTFSQFCSTWRRSTCKARRSCAGLGGALSGAGAGVSLGAALARAAEPRRHGRLLDLVRAAIGAGDEAAAILPLEGRVVAKPAFEAVIGGASESKENHRRSLTISLNRQYFYTVWRGW